VLVVAVYRGWRVAGEDLTGLTLKINRFL